MGVWLGLCVSKGACRESQTLRTAISYQLMLSIILKYGFENLKVNINFNPLAEILHN